MSIGLNVHCTPVSFLCFEAPLYCGEPLQAFVFGWMFGTAPTYLYDLFSSTQISTLGYGMNNINVNDSSLDGLLANYRFACGNATSCASQSQAIETYIFRHGYYFPIYSQPADTAARNDSYTGYYNQIGYGMGFNPFWSLMNAHVTGCTPMPTCGINANNVTAGRPFTMGLRDPIQGWNPLSTNDDTIFDSDVYSMIFDTLTKIDPVTLTPTLPWIGSFTKAPYNGPLNGNQPGAVYHWTLASNATWSNGAPITAHDLNWTIKLLQGHYGRDGLPVALFLPAVTHITTSVVTGTDAMDVYYNSSSFFSDFDADLPIFPSARWNGTDGVMGTANAPGTAAYLFKNSPAAYEPGSFTNITNFFMGSGAFVVESYDSTTGTATLLNRASTAHAYWRPAPTASQAFYYIDGTLGKEPFSTGNSSDLYHAPWLHEITYVVVGSDMGTAILCRQNFCGPFVDLTGWNIPSSWIGTIETFLVKAGKGFFTAPPNFGMFYFAVNLDEGTGPYRSNPFGNLPNPFFNTYPLGTVGSAFRAGLNHLIDRSGIADLVCGFGCAGLTGVVPPIYNIGGYSFHNSSIDTDPLAQYNPGALNDTLNSMASKGLVQFNPTDGYWHFLIPYTPLPAMPSPMVYLAVLSILALVLRRRVRVEGLSTKYRG